MIVFIDDEQAKAEVFVEHMKNELGLPVRYFSGVDVAWQFLIKRHKPVEVLVLDIMMPPGELLKDRDVEDGILTGLALLDLFRQEFVDCYVFVLTNLTDPKVAERVLRDPHCELHIKSDVYYDDFAQNVKKRYESIRGGAD